MSTIITKKQFNNHIYKTEIAGRPFSLEFGKVAELANASAMVRYGDTSVLVAVTAAPRPRDGVDFFPLSVDFEEKLYAVGRIPGSFMRREGRPHRLPGGGLCGWSDRHEPQPGAEARLQAGPHRGRHRRQGGDD